MDQTVYGALRVSQYSVRVDEKDIIKNLDFELKSGRVHALMGPNGSGKSSFAQALIGHPHYTISSGSVWLNGHDVTHAPAHERARAGLFLAFQNPPAIPGVRVETFLYEALCALRQERISVSLFKERLQVCASYVGISEHFMTRALNDGFSGGERKRFEMLQMLLFEPRVVILDEIDSGLDVDGIALVAKALRIMRERNPHCCVLLITHYQRILQQVIPDEVSILCNGRLVEHGGSELAHTLERTGYERYQRAEP